MKLNSKKILVTLLVLTFLISLTVPFLQVKPAYAVQHNFGYETIGASTLGPQDVLVGSVFTITENGTADSITVALRRIVTTLTEKVKCAIYLHSDRSLVGSTEERVIALTDTAVWYVFNFVTTKPSLTTDTAYILFAWSDYVSGDGTICMNYAEGDTNQGHFQDCTYNNFPATVTPSHENVKYSIYCTYTTIPPPPVITLFSSLDDDGLIEQHDYDSSYATVWAATTGDVDDTSAVAYIGQQKITEETSIYTIFRSFLFFNTSTIPSNATITSAKLSLYLKWDWTVTTDFDVVIQNGQPTYPHMPLVAGDFDKNHYSGDGGKISTLGWTLNTYKNITMSSIGLSWITKGDITKLCLRSSKDISATPPAEGDSYIGIGTLEYGANYVAKLYISYETEVTITIVKPVYATYTTSKIPVEITATGGTIDKKWYNCKNSIEWIYPSNITYTVPTTMTGFTNGTYTFYGWANNTEGWKDERTVMFTVAIPPQPSIFPPINLKNIPLLLGNALGIGEFAGGVLASLILLVVLLLLCVVVVGKLGGGTGGITITVIIVGFSTVVFCTAVQWISPWITVFISLGTALGIGWFISKTAHSSEG